MVAVGQPATEARVVFTNAAQIRQITASDAARMLPVHFRGVVISGAGPSVNRAAVIQDETAGVYVLAAEDLFTGINRGDFVEVIGVTDPGEFAPIVKVTRVSRLGTAPIPAAKVVTGEDLLSGRLDAQWIEITGVVRSLDAPAPRDFGQWHMELATGSGKVSVISIDPKPPEIAPDTVVRLQATCFYQFTRKRQVLKPALLVPSGVPIQVVEPPPAEPDSVPIQTIASLLEFSPKMGALQRVHVRGVVLSQEPGTVVWIRDNTGALRVHSRQHERLQPGDEIDVLGFPKYGSHTPALEDAVFEKLGSGETPAAVELAAPEEAFEHPANLVALVGTLREIQRLPDGWILEFQNDGTLFKALLRIAGENPPASRWRPGSLARVAGICSIVANDAEPVLSGVWEPETFQLLLRSPADLTIVKPASWWTPRHIIELLIGVIGGSLLIIGFLIWRARLGAREQARRRAMAEAEFAAILSERNRLARELHDSLAQGLVAASVQLRLAKKRADPAANSLSQCLDAAQQLVSSTLHEARSSIWNMRSQILETGDLSDALAGILAQMARDTDLKTACRVIGTNRRLAPIVENNILRVGQEAITNAVRHARASEIKLTLEFGETHFRLLVEDDGNGFSPDKSHGSNGSFGLRGMHERAAELKGRLTVRSAPGQGTLIALEVPV